MVEPLLSRDDLDALSDHAADADEPSAVAAQLEAASGRLANPTDAAYAYLLAAEIHERADDLPQALTLVERALTVRGAAAHDLRQARSYRAQLLLQLGREDEAAPDEYETGGAYEAGEEYEAGEGYGDGQEYADAAGEFDRAPDLGRDADLDLGDFDPERYGPYLDPEGSPEADALLLVWSREAYEQVEQRWPEVLEPTGADSWDDYRRYCQVLITGWSRRGRSLALVTGDADGFEEWLAEQGADPYYANLVGLAQGYGRYLAEEGDPVEMPPGRDDPCWCGSGKAYAGCCMRLVS